MMLDVEKLKEIAKSLEVEISFNSDAPGIISVKDDLSSTYTPFDSLKGFFDTVRSSYEEYKKLTTEYVLTVEAIVIPQNDKKMKFNLIDGPKHNTDGYKSVNIFDIPNYSDRGNEAA